MAIPMMPIAMKAAISLKMFFILSLTRPYNAGLGGARYFARAAEADPTLAFRALARDRRSRCYTACFHQPLASPFNSKAFAKVSCSRRLIGCLSSNKKLSLHSS